MSARRDARARDGRPVDPTRDGLTTEPEWGGPEFWRKPGQSDARAYVNFIGARRRWRVAHGLTAHPT